MAKKEKIQELEDIIKDNHHATTKHKEAKAELQKLLEDHKDEEGQEEIENTETEAPEKEEEIEYVKEETKEKPASKPKAGGPQEPKPKIEKEEEVDLDDVELDFEVNPSETYVFKLEKRSTGRYILPKVIDIWDDTKEQIRKIRYSQTEHTPFLDSQKDSSKVSSREIQFSKGELRVSGKDICLLKYLVVFDGNAEKKQINPDNQRYKGLYKLYRGDIALKESRKLRESRLEASNIVANASKEELTDFLRSNFRFNPTSQGEATKEDSLYNEAYKYAQSHPDLFVSDFNNIKHKYKSLAQQGFEQRVLGIENEAVVWQSTKAEVYKNENKDVREDEALARWGVAYKEGAEFFKNLNSKLS